MKFPDLFGESFLCLSANEASTAKQSTTVSSALDRHAVGRFQGALMLPSKEALCFSRDLFHIFTTKTAVQVSWGNQEHRQTICAVRGKVRGRGMDKHRKPGEMGSFELGAEYGCAWVSAMHPVTLADAGC